MSWTQLRAPEQALAVAIAIVLFAAVVAAVLVEPRREVDAEAAARCAVGVARELGLDPVSSATAREERIRMPGGGERLVWAAGVPAQGFVLELQVARDGAILGARGIAASGADPLPRADRVAALEMRCAP